MRATQETIQRLCWHAGLAEPPLEHVSPSISDCTAPGSADDESLGIALADFVDALSALNHELNGAAPSEAIGRGGEEIPLQVAYAVAEVARMLRRSGGDAWSVDTAWLAVLAGDIDDIHEHLAEERWAGGGREAE